MKKILYIILIALLSVVAESVKATPLSGSGTETDPYIIATTADWTEFCENHATYKNSYIKMANFVTAATNKYFDDTFSGTFDGDGYTLTVNISGGRVAPFMQVKNGTIKNLRVAGSITGSANHTSGLISFCTSNTTCTIQNCIVSATITNTANLGGFIGHGYASTTINMTDCVFNGTLNYSGASNGTNISTNINYNTFSKKVGGFVSWEGNGTTIFNLSRCLFDGTINCTAGFTPFIVKYSGCNVSGSDTASCLYTVAKSSGFPSSYTVFDGTSAIGQTAEQIVTTMNNAGGNGWRVFKGKAEPTMRPLRTLGNIPDGWTVTANGDTITVTNGTATITEGDTVVLTPTNPALVKNVTLVDAPTPTPSCRRITLDTVQHHFVAQDCDTLTGTLGENVKISIADGATVTLKNASISYSSKGADYAGLTLIGNGTIQLADGTTNNIIGGLDNDNYSNWPGIFVPEGKTLTINGNTGVLNAARGGDDIDDGSPAGIGASWNNNCGNIVINGGFINATGGGKGAGIGSCGRRGCGNITINGGTVTATGGSGAPGIGLGGTNSSSYTDGGTCGDITISGGTVNASGGEGGAGIGTGYSSNTKDVTVTKTCGNILISGGTITATGGNDAAGIGTGKTNSKGIINIGTITITNGVTLVTATKGSGAPNSIGKGTGTNITCGTVTIGGVVYWNGSSYQNGGDTYLPTSPLVYPTPAPSVTDLATITENYTASNGETLTGTLGANVKISIADGATVTLNNVTINGTNNSNYEWAGITCLGDATIILSGTNTVKGFYQDYPGIQAAAGKTLTINGTGSLTASSYGWGAGIGGGSGVACGDIEIQGGTITATSGEYGAGIGGGNNASWGNITISGGTVTATGGWRGAGIGGGRKGLSNVSCGNIYISGGTVTATGGEEAAGIGGGRGYNNSYKSSCGTITITTDVTKVTATKGSDAPNSIGAGNLGTCGTVTIGGTQGAITDSPYTYPPQP